MHNTQEEFILISLLREWMSNITKRIFKTDKSKRRQVGFVGKVLTDEKSAQLFLGPFLIQPIILFLFA
jgi:hypothetical protein